MGLFVLLLVSLRALMYYGYILIYIDVYVYIYNIHVFA